MNIFIVELWSRVFSVLRWLSVFQVIRVCIPPVRKSYVFVEVWVLGNLCSSVVLLGICSAPGLRWWELLIITYGTMRVIEIVVYQINVLLFDEYRTKKAGERYALCGFRRIVILLVHNYIEIVFWYAIIYRNMTEAFTVIGSTLNSYLESVNLSFVTMTSFGQTGASPIMVSGTMLITSQAATGLFMALLVLARFISLIPEPDTMDDLEKTL